MSRFILVCGATGKQGGAVIENLLREKANFDILAVTRDATSGSAQRLLKKSSRISLVQGNLADPTTLFETAKNVAKAPIWGVFDPLGFNQGGGGELGQGKALIDASLKAGVKFFVQTSVDRHGDDSINNPTRIPHFKHKHQIEQHLINQSKGTDMKWTILRPVAFMDNFVDGFPGRLFVTWWRMALKDKPLQLVATSDIGFFGAQAFMAPERYKGRGVSLAGDSLTYDQMQGVFGRVLGNPAPGSSTILSWLLMKMVKDIGYMFKWFHDEGYAANIPELRKEHPGLKDFETWLKTESDFKKQIR